MIGRRELLQVGSQLLDFIAWPLVIAGGVEQRFLFADSLHEVAAEREGRVEIFRIAAAIFAALT